MNLWDMYGLDSLALGAGFKDGERADHSFGLLVYSLIYGFKSQRVVCIGYGNGYVPVLATAGQFATGRRGLVLSVDGSPQDRGEYVSNHGYNETHKFVHGDPLKVSGHVVDTLGGLIDFLVIAPYEDWQSLWAVYSPLLREDGIAVIRGITGTKLPGYNSIELPHDAVMLRRHKD